MTTPTPKPSALAAVILALLLVLPLEVGLFILVIGHTVATFATLVLAVVLLAGARRLIRRK